MNEFLSNVPYGVMLFYCFYLCAVGSDTVEKNMLKSTLLFVGGLALAVLSAALMMRN